MSETDMARLRREEAQAWADAHAEGATIHVAVLRVLRDFYAGSVLNHAEKAAALDHAIATCEQHAALVARLGEFVDRLATDRTYDGDIVDDLRDIIEGRDLAHRVIALTAAAKEDEWEVCRHLGAENEYSDWAPCPPHMVESLKRSDAHIVRKKVTK